jgi:DNA modification methylase
MNYQGDIKALPIADNSIDLIFADPPYQKEYLYTYHWLALEAIRVLKPGGFVVALVGDLYINKIFNWFDTTGLVYFALLNERLKSPYPMIWKRSLLASSRYMIAYSKGEGKLRVGGMLTSYTGNGAMKQYHHWGQAVGSARYYIDHFSAEGDVVLDPFTGGGTTAAACALIGRRSINGDIDPRALLTTRDRLRGKDAPMATLPMFAAA